MIFTIKTVACSGTLFLVLAAGCSTSEFGSKAGKNTDGPAAKKRTETSENSEVDRANGETEGQSDGTDQNVKGAERFENRSDSDANSHNADTEVSEGCRLPADVKGMIDNPTKSTKPLFGLLGWGSTDSPVAKMDLTNVDIRDCSWFAKLNSDPNTKFAFVYQKKALGLQAGVSQSYVEPAEGIQDQRTCSRTAAGISRSVAQTGVFQCALIPRDPNGKVIEN